MVKSTVLPVFVAKALRQEPLSLRGPRNYAQNFVHVSDIAELATALVLGACAPSTINAFSDDTYGLSSLAELVRSKLGSLSEVVDNTDDASAPKPVFVNL